MADQHAGAAIRSIERAEWSSWCATLTEAKAGRVVTLSFVDDALGEVVLASDKPLVSIDYDELGSAVAFTVSYGDGVVPIRYVIAEPSSVAEEIGDDESVARLVFEDKTRRRTFIALA